MNADRLNLLRFKLVLLCVIIVLVSPQVKAASPQFKAVSPSELFQGFDSVVGQTRFKALTGEKSSSGASSTVEYKICTDTYSLKKALGINQSGSASFGPYGGDEKVNFLNQIETTKYSVYVVLHAQHIESTETATSGEFNNSAQPSDLLTFSSHDSQIKNFFLAYGDSYVSSVTKGGEYFAVYTFHTENSSDQNHVAVSIGGQASFGIIQAGGSLQTSLDTVIKTSHSDWSFKQSAYGVKNPSLPPDANGAVDYAIKFPSLPLDQPTVLSFETTGYEHVPRGGYLGQLAKNRAYFVGTDEGDGFSTKLLQLHELKTQVERLLGINKFYGAAPDQKLNLAYHEVDADIRALDNQVHEFEANPTGSYSLPPLPSLALGTPSLSFSTSSSGECGGPGGAIFNDVDLNTAVYHQQRLAAVQMRAGSWIDNLIVTYERDGAIEPRISHGGSGGHLSPQLQILGGQFISSIDLQCANGGSAAFVKHLDIHLATDGGAIHSGVNSPGDPATWKTPEGSVLVGFRGNAGDYLDKLQAVYIKIGPANWQTQ